MTAGHKLKSMEILAGFWKRKLSGSDSLFEIQVMI